jgi:hypothetical protein
MLMVLVVIMVVILLISGIRSHRLPRDIIILGGRITTIHAGLKLNVLLLYILVIVNQHDACASYFDRVLGLNYIMSTT